MSSPHQSPINTGDAPNNQAATPPFQLQIEEVVPDPNSQLVHCITQRQESPTKNPSKEDEEGEEERPPSPSTSIASPSPDRHNNNGDNNTTSLQDSVPQQPQDQEEPPQDKADGGGSGHGNNNALDDTKPQDVVEPPQDKVDVDNNMVEPPQDKEENAAATAVVPSPATASSSPSANLKTPSLWDQLEESSSNNPSLHNFDDLIIPSLNHPQATNYLRESFNAWTSLIKKHAMPEPSSIFQFMEMAIMLCHLHEFWKQPNPLRLPTPGTRVDFVGQHCISFGLHHRTVPHYYKKSGGGGGGDDHDDGGGGDDDDNSFDGAEDVESDLEDDSVGTSNCKWSHQAVKAKLQEYHQHNSSLKVLSMQRFILEAVSASVNAFHKETRKEAMTIAQYISDRNKGLPLGQEVRHSIHH